MSDLSEFDAICNEWKLAHPDEEVPVGDLFAQWLANESGIAIIGSPVGEAPAVIAVPDEGES